MRLNRLPLGEREAFGYWLEEFKGLDIDSMSGNSGMDFGPLYDEFKQYKAFEDLMWRVEEAKAQCHITVIGKDAHQYAYH